VTAADHCERRLGRTEHSDVLILRRSIGERAAVGFRGMPFIGSDDEAGQPPERWVTGTLALFDFIFVECFTVARNEGPHDGMLWLVGLQVANTNALFPEPGTSNFDLVAFNYAQFFSENFGVTVGKYDTIANGDMNAFAHGKGNEGLGYGITLRCLDASSS